MRIVLHIGAEACGAARIQSVLAARRGPLSRQGVHFAESPGNKNHTRLWMALTDPGHVDPLRYYRGFANPDRQQSLRTRLQEEIAAEIKEARPDVLVLSAAQMCWLSGDEITRARDFLHGFSKDIKIVAHLDEPSSLLSRIYASQVLDGRSAPLSRDLALAGSADWWAEAQTLGPAPQPATALFTETQGVPFWLDYTALTHAWDSVFGPGAMALRSFDIPRFSGGTIADEIRDTFGIEGGLGRPAPVTFSDMPSAAWLARARQFNHLLLHLMRQQNQTIPRQLWRSMLNELRVDGPAIPLGSLAEVARHFAPQNAALAARHPGLNPDLMTPPEPSDLWTEADTTRGFRASQYLLAFKWKIDQAFRGEDKAALQPPALSPSASALMPAQAKENFAQLYGSPFAPHNRIGMVNEEDLAADYTPAPPRTLPKGSSGTVIVGCMKNEAPYILEWVAYHRAIGVDNFLIYTNGCTDGTDEILDRLQALGIVQHRLNDDWRGKSPQQFALNRSLSEPVIQNADWIAHIDVDEFINVRCGNGTLADFHERVPDATNIAMTWRLFGHNGITRLDDKLVIDQFDTCAPKFCPKPHTVWGFKTMFRNIGAYGKISCHRPNKLAEGREGDVRWVNGSGKDITRETARNGWRSSKKSVGYDLLQLNHYALRSAESFLIKRQRGRALHVDRSIGINYWIRMDWSVHRDLTIKRNIPRVEAEIRRLMEDPELARWHGKGLAWHRAKADELHATPEFRELYEKALEIELTETERVAYALALDMES